MLERTSPHRIHDGEVELLQALAGDVARAQDLAAMSRLRLPAAGNARNRLAAAPERKSTAQDRSGRAIALRVDL